MSIEENGEWCGVAASMDHEHCGNGEKIGIKRMNRCMLGSG
jgi:hypothetical protein